MHVGMLDKQCQSELVEAYIERIMDIQGNIANEMLIRLAMLNVD